MTRLSTLTRLRDMVRNADGADEPINVLLWRDVDLSSRLGDPRECRYTAYSEDAMALAERLLPDCKISVRSGRRQIAQIRLGDLEAAAYGNTRPLAILDCLLSILIEKEGRDG